jgi:hypothetical protein
MCDDMMSRDYDFPVPQPENVRYDLELFLIAQSLKVSGKALKDFDLPEPEHPWGRYSRDRVVHSVAKVVTKFLLVAWHVGWRKLLVPTSV